MLKLGYREPNVHELLVHELARRLGEYELRGVEVEVVNGLEHADAPLSAGLGGAAVERLRGKRCWVVRQVHTVRPLFWLWSREGIEATGLAGRPVATHPVGSPPWRMAARVLTRLGTGIESVSALPSAPSPGGDLARLDALVSGRVDAAVIGSSVAPAAAERLGLRRLVFFGDLLHVPTVGVAVDTSRMAADDAELAALLEAQKAAMDALREGDPLAIDAVQALVPECSRADAGDYVDRYLSPGYGVPRTEAREAAAEFLSWLRPEIGADGHVDDVYLL